MEEVARQRESLKHIKVRIGAKAEGRDRATQKELWKFSEREQVLGNSFTSQRDKNLSW